MKIYTRVVIDMASGVVEAEESFEYTGPLALATGDAPEAQPMSPEERQLLQLQAQEIQANRRIRDRQLREHDLLSNLAYRQAGLRLERDAAGEVTGISEMSEAELDPRLRQQRDLERRFGERTLAALEGRLPVDPGLLETLNEEEETLQERLRRELGSGYATSSPGVEALGDFSRRRQQLLDQARRGDLTLAEQLGQARTSSNIASTSGTLGNMFSPASRFNNPFSMGAQNINAIQGPLNFMQRDRQMQLQASMAAADANARSMAGFGQFAGTAAGFMLGGPAGAGPGGYMGGQFGQLFRA